MLDVKDETQWVIINEGRQVAGKPKIIIGPGTGLGCAIISFNKTEGSYNVHAGEGGHVEFPATDDTELALRKFALQWFKDNEDLELKRLSTERVCAGPALPLLYEFFQTQYPDLEVVVKPDPNTGKIEPNGVLENALHERDPLCLKVIEQFVKILGTITGDMAITTLCYGGIYLCGGVAVKLKDYLLSSESKFLEILCNKGRMSQRVAEIPVYLLIGEPGLDGSEQYGLQAYIFNYDE